MKNHLFRCARHGLWQSALAAGLIGGVGCQTLGPAANPALPSTGTPSSERPSQTRSPLDSSKKPTSPVPSPLFAEDSAIRQAAHTEKGDDEPLPIPRKAPTADPLPTTEPAPADRLPIDLPTALRLAGANNLQIALARERVSQAQARLEAAGVLWVPSLNAGVGYNHHDGRVQDTRGEIIETSRSAFFVGGGPNFGPAPLTGPGGPPARLFLGLPLSDLLFAPLAEKQTVRASNANLATNFNDTLRDVALAYLELVRTQGRVAVAREAVTNAEELHRLVASRVKAGKAPPADELRAEGERESRRRQQAQAEEAVRVASADLVRLVRLNPAVTLFPAEGQPVPIDLVKPEQPLPDLIAQGLTSRPELAENQALVQAALKRLEQEKWRPLLPTLQVGLSAGGFGGGEGSTLGRFNDRLDFDALMVWEMRNLGLGNAALSRERSSQERQARLTAEQMSDLIAAEVVRAYYQVRQRQVQVEAARAEVKATAEALPLNFKGILGDQLRAIEAQQAVQALAAARFQYLDAVVDYNRAQFQLLRALGRAPETPACES